MAKWIASISVILLIGTNALWVYLGYNFALDSAVSAHFHEEMKLKLKRLENINDAILDAKDDEDKLVVFDQVKSEYTLYREENPDLDGIIFSSTFDSETKAINVVVNCKE